MPLYACPQRAIAATGTRRAATLRLLGIGFAKALGPEGVCWSRGRAHRVQRGKCPTSGAFVYVPVTVPRAAKRIRQGH
jgi:hypothetical protein